MRILVFSLFLLSNLLSNGVFKPLPKVIEYDTDIIDLGRELFYDKLLSKNQDISCFSCHNNYGVDNQKLSIGSDGKIGVINSPSIFNLKYKSKFFWNGRVDSLEEQLIDGPLFNPHEMANDKNTIISRIKNSKKYNELFSKAYGSKPTFKLLLDAIARFQETLISSESKFDKYLRGEIKLSKQEQDGFGLFIDYGCASCHNGINLGGNSYQKIGSVIPIKIHESGEWKDRSDITKRDEDKMVFIVPSLRNIEKTAPYFHSGTVSTLKGAIEIMGFHNIGIILEDDEIDAIEAFLKTLTGNIPKTFDKEK